MSEWLDVWFDADGTRLFAVEKGRGAPVIFLHGGLANHLACRPVAEALVANHRVVTPDLRGSGRSIYAGALTWERLADDVAAIVRQLGASRATVGGVSFGSGVAVAFALRHPDLIDRLVVQWPAFAGADVGLMPAQAEAMAAMDAYGHRAPAEGIEVIFPLFDRLPPPIRDRMHVVAAGYDPGSVATSTKFMASGAQPFGAAAQLANIRVPTLVVPGIDPYHPAEFAELYARHIPDCTVRAGDPASAVVEFLAG
jgi:pimeloyl-ACP methyl ester carboxylesterase